MKVKPLKDWARVATYTYKINYYICLLEEGGVGVNGSDQDVQWFFLNCNHTLIHVQLFVSFDSDKNTKDDSKQEQEQEKVIKLDT